MNSSQSGLDLLSHERIIESVSLIILMIISSFLNITTCAIIARNKLLRISPANLFVANLCLSNMVLTLFVIPFSLATLVRDEHRTYAGTAACTVNGFLSVAACSAIVMTLCCISIDRYIAVNKPTKYRTLLTCKRAVCMILLVWFQALLYASLPILGWSNYEYHQGTLHCSPAWTSKCSLYIFIAVVCFAFPLSVMFVTYIRIFLVIRKHSRRVTTLKLSVLSCQVNPVLSMTQEQYSQSPNVQNLSLDSPAESNENALRKESTECPVTPSAIVTQEAGNMSRFIKPDELLSTGNQLGPPFEDLSQHILSSCDLFEETQPSPANNKPTVLTDQRSLSKKRSMRRMFQNLQSKIRTGKRDEGQLPREYKIAKTGFLLLILFLILWLPYLVVNACTTKIEAPESVFHVAMWLVYMNGVANPVAYAFNNKRVKTKFKQIFHKIFGFFTRCR